MLEPPRTLVGALAEQGWSQADGAFARGWRECFVLARELKALSRTQAVRASSSAARKVAALNEQCDLIKQSLALVAEQRGLSLLGAIGEEVVYDARRHNAPAPEPGRSARVCIVAPGVTAGDKIIVNADVTPAKSRRRSREGR